MERLARFVVRFPWLIVALWIIGVVAVTLTTPSGAAVKTPSPHPFDAQRAYNLLDASFPNTSTSGNHPPVNILLLAHGKPLASADIARLNGLSSFLLRWRRDNGDPMVAWPPVVRVSTDKQAYLVSLTFPWANYCYECQDTIEAQLATIRPTLQPGTTVTLTGQGLIYQAEDAALSGLTDSGISPTLLACIVLVLVVLGAVYRAPLAVVVPLLAIGVAVYTSLDLAKTLAAHTDWMPHGDITNEFISIVLFGAGTNYCLFLLSRYRESLRDGMAPRLAIVHSLTRVGEAISSSAGTVIAATAVMGFTLSPMLRAVGPAVAVAIAVMLLAGLTLVPALMYLTGRALLWPSYPAPSRPLGAAKESRVRGLWGRIGTAIAAHPLATALACLALLLPLAAFVTQLSPSYDDLRALPSANPAVRTALAIQAHFGSTTEPTTLVVHDPSGNVRDPAGARAVAALRAAVLAVPGVQVRGAEVVSPDGQVAAVPLLIHAETSSPAAHALIGRMQDALRAAAASQNRPGLEGLLAGDSAFTHDQKQQINADFTFIIIWVSLIIFVILMLLVRSLSAPLYLLLTVALSAGASVGLTVLIFHTIMRQEVYYTTPIFAFVFLVALGEDFNILLMSRIREEVLLYGLRPGVARAVGTTGGTLSNCGVIMAGTFAVLMSFQVTFLQQVGFAVAAGVLLDTFVVRPLLVPAVVCLLGRWNWVTPRGAAVLPAPVQAGVPA